jgi:hypothetical protein
MTWSPPPRPVRREPRPYVPPAEPTSARTRRRISTSDGDFIVDADGNVIEQVPDSRSPVYEYMSSPPEEVKDGRE